MRGELRGLPQTIAEIFYPFSEAPVLAWRCDLAEIHRVGGSDNSSGGRLLLGVHLRGVTLGVLELARYAAGDIHLRSCCSRRGAARV